MPDATQAQAAVDRLAVELGQSVLVEDLRKQPCWWSAQGAVDGTRMSSILQRRADPRALAVIDRLRIAEATTPVHTPPVPEVDMWSRWCMPVRHDGHLLGFLWVLDPDGVVREADLPLIVECADVAGETLAWLRESAETVLHARADLVDRLLRGVDDEAARELARLEHLPHDAAVQVQAPARGGGWALPDGLSAHVAGTRRRTATSGAPLPLRELREAARRATATRRAIAAGARPDPATWDGLGAWRLVVDAPETLAVADVHPGAETLAAQTRTDLMTTARVVLDSGGDIAASAAALHLHRTTLYYRLDRIQALTGVDLRDGRARTDLQLALWLASYRGTET
jgi:PucR-like helix-turn-helix protein